MNQIDQWKQLDLYERFCYLSHMIGEQQRLRNEQTRQSLHCLHTQSMDVDEASDQNLEPILLDKST